MRWIKAVWGQRRMTIFRWEICLHINVEKSAKGTDESLREEEMVTQDWGRFTAIVNFDEIRFSLKLEGLAWNRVRAFLHDTGKKTKDYEH